MVGSFGDEIWFFIVTLHGSDIFADGNSQSWDCRV
jgi:hypothetical protein